MKYTWKSALEKEITIKKFLTAKKVSHRILAQIKHGEGKILLNGQQAVLNQIVSGLCEVTLWLPPENNSVVPLENGQLRVLFEDMNWLVVDKPAGITSVPGPSNRTTTLVNRVKGYLIKNGAQDSVPHLITRLDRDTSGIVLIAKHRFAQGMINKQVEEHQIDKKYLAVIKGCPEKLHAVIDAPIGRVGQEIKRCVTSQGQSARTEYWVLASSSKASLLEVKLHTGRTHQIRVHLDSLGYPLFGDELYGGVLDAGIDRQALHSFKLTYTDPFTLQEKKVLAPMPADMRCLCSKLGLKIQKLGKN
ncbi:RluA family pseudouridine synthase [Liquorilactobacillus oeni]|uniref:Pseudouridine synthase n=1 Tax=Liquorilactobacillus oeni DSM 19972 TaxID=1423777 RepID=A0A0R1MI73_9LACO|nr:RluA family pseudouridine synthase [Liquorilactobacillus oeni]KRL05620.1 ribosomal large subunit pseudouridine synthase D [Liquorilactobacillus oeni DSM 19972]